MSYNDFDTRIMLPQLLHHPRERIQNSTRRIPMTNIITPQMNRDHIRRIPFQPSRQQVQRHDMASQVSRMAFAILVIAKHFAAAGSLTAVRTYEVDVCVARGLEFFPEIGAPADYVCDAVADGHVSNRPAMLGPCCCEEQRDRQDNR